MTLRPVTLERRPGLPTDRSQVWCGWDRLDRFCVIGWSDEFKCWECSYRFKDGSRMTAFADARNGLIAAHAAVPERRGN